MRRMNVDPFNATTHPAAADVLVRRIIEFTRLTRDNGFRAAPESGSVLPSSTGNMRGACNRRAPW